MTEKELVREIMHRRPVVCRECGEKLKYIGGGEYVCTSCKESCYDDFGKVRQFLYENGPTPAPEVVAATGVPNHIVIELLKEGRIELLENSKFFLRCERCGCAIRFGRICPDCAKKYAQTLSEAMKESVGERPRYVTAAPQKRGDQKMRYYDKGKGHTPGDKK